jgi:hypothetical protein
VPLWYITDEENIINQRLSGGSTGGLTIPHIIVFVCGGLGPGHGFVPIKRSLIRESSAELKYDTMLSLFFAISCKDALLSPIPIRAVVVLFVFCEVGICSVVTGGLQGCSKHEIGAEDREVLTLIEVLPVVLLSEVAF